MVQGTTEESRNEAPYIDPESIGLVITAFVSITVMIFWSVWLEHIFLWLYLWGLYSYWQTFLKMTISMMIGSVIYLFLFEWQLAKYLPKGWPIFEDASFGLIIFVGCTCGLALEKKWTKINTSWVRSLCHLSP